MQFAQRRRAVDPGETAAFVDDLARHHDEVDTIALRPLDDGVEDRGLRVEIGIGALVPVDQPEIGGLADRKLLFACPLRSPGVPVERLGFLQHQPGGALRKDDKV